MGKGVLIELRGSERAPVVKIISPKSPADSMSTKSTFVFPVTVIPFESAAYPTKDAVIVADPLGSESEKFPSSFVRAPRPPLAVTDAPEIPLPEISDTLPLTVF